MSVLPTWEGFNRLILIEAARLIELMIRAGVGVQTKDSFHVVEIDEDFFE